MIKIASLERRVRSHRGDAVATLMLAAGVEMRTVMDVLGHSQIGITMDLYAHVLPPARADAASRVDALLAPPSIKPDEASPGTSGQTGGQTDRLTDEPDQELRGFWKELMVSPEGIEPSTYRLRVCCSAS